MLLFSTLSHGAVAVRVGCHVDDHVHPLDRALHGAEVRQVGQAQPVGGYVR